MHNIVVSKLLNNTDTENVEFHTDLITKSTWSPYVFKENTRNSANFQSARIFAIDIDGGMSIEEGALVATSLGVQFIIGTTRNHRKEKKGKISDRYRIIFFLKKEITDANELKTLFYHLKNNYFPTMDEACKDAARLFYPCQEIYMARVDSDIPLLEWPPPTTSAHPSPSQTLPTTVVTGRLPLSKKSMRFIKDGAPEGERNAPFVALCHDAKQQLWTFEELMDYLSEHGKAWMVNDEYREKARERFANAIINHPPRVGKTNKIPDVIGLQEVSRWLTEANLKVSYSRQIWSNKTGECLAVPTISRLIRLEMARQNVKITDGLIDDMVIQWVERERGEHKKNIIQKLIVDNGVDRVKGDRAIRNFLGVLNENFTELDVAVMKHMIWLIKNKLMGRTHKVAGKSMMFVITGGQRAGKSYALNNYLLKPLEDLSYGMGDFEKINDPREARLFNDHYAFVFDEMSGAIRSDMEKLKQLITAPTFKQRLMGTTEHAFLEMNATLFGTANRPLHMLILDNTGMRRFYEFVAQSYKVTSKRWYVLNNLDVYDIWKCVDDNDEDSPLFTDNELMQQLSMHQENLRARKPVEAWIEDNGVVIDDHCWTASGELLRAFIEADGSNYTANSFARELLCIEGVKKRRINGRSEYNLRLTNPDSLRKF